MRFLLLIFIFVWPSLAASSASSWAIKLCKNYPDKYECKRHKIPRKYKVRYTTWNKISPTHSRLLMAINRRNTFVWHNHIIAMPKNWDESYMNHAPFPQTTQRTDEKYILVDLNKLAWAAYENHNLVNWGPANGGMKLCRETGEMKCKTHTGTHFILRLDGVGKRSSLYPPKCEDKKKCGHSMPYFMPFYYDGTGLHGNKWLTGRNSSHGCVRLITKDASWINKSFAYVGMPVIVLEY